jgi:hypothetical protein
VDPAATDALVDEALMAKSDPIPDKTTVCGLLETLSVNTREPERVPVAFGENEITKLQLELELRVLGQVFVCRKSPVS